MDAGWSPAMDLTRIIPAVNLKKMLAGETGANKGKKEAALKAKEAGCDPAYAIFDESSRDEGGHARSLEGLLKRYFPSALS